MEKCWYHVFQFLLIGPAETWHNALYSWNIQLQFEICMTVNGQILSSTTDIYFSVFNSSLQEPVCPHHNKKYIPEHHWCTAICFPVIAETHTIGTHPLIRSFPDINFMVLIKDNICLVTKINWRPLILYVECNFLQQNPGLLSRFTGGIVIFFEMTWCLYQY
jgi:hypothetical protein